MTDIYCRSLFSNDFSKVCDFNKYNACPGNKGKIFEMCLTADFVKIKL
jgi:hypothetical protein